MKLEKYLNHPDMQGYIRTVAPGEYLFRQGQLANTAFFIIHGVVELVGERDDAEHVESTLRAGDFLGEKALLSSDPYQRRFGARAKDLSKIVELGHKDLVPLQNAIPGMVADVMRLVFEITYTRLERSNFLARALRPKGIEARIVGVVEYFCRSAGKRAGRIIELPLTIDAVRFYVDATDSEIETVLKRLVNDGLLMPKTKGVFLVPNEVALHTRLQELEEAA